MLGRWSAVPLVALVVLSALAGALATPAGAVDSGASARAPLPVGDTDGDVAPPADSAAVPRVSTALVRADDGARVRVAVEVPDAVDALWVLTDDARLVASDGVRQGRATRGERYRVDGEASSATLELAPRVDPSSDRLLGVETDGWVFAPLPRLVVAWRPADGGDIRRVRPFEDRGESGVSVAVEGRGVVGEQYALLGRHAVHSARVDGQRVRLVVPAGVDLAASPTAALGNIAAAGARLDSGDRGDGTTIFALSGVRPGGATAVAHDETWIDADSRLRGANNVWLHEYVHARQAFDLAPEMAWFREASAEYLAASLARETDLVGEVGYQTYLAGREASGAVLADPGTWPADDVAYHRGVRVLAALDRAIRERTGGERSLADVFRRLNAHDGVVTHAVFARAVAGVAGTSMDGWLDRHVRGSARVSPTSAPFVPLAAATDAARDPLGRPAVPLGTLLTGSLTGAALARRRG